MLFRSRLLEQGELVCAAETLADMVLGEHRHNPVLHAARGRIQLQLGAVAEASASFRVCEQLLRSEERRVGKECRSRWSPYH